MSTPYIGQISITGFNFAPKGWALCNGQLLSIQQNAALFSILGTTYGGNGVTNFQLPNLQGRVGIHMGSSPNGSYVEGEVGGEATHTLIQSEMPSHTHTIGAASLGGTSPDPTNHVWAASTDGDSLYISANQANVTMSPAALGTGGGSQPHDNMQPYLVVNFIIALQGIFPSRT
jgi:microcystin-dependent protein